MFFVGFIAGWIVGITVYRLKKDEIESATQTLKLKKELRSDDE